MRDTIEQESTSERDAFWNAGVLTDPAVLTSAESMQFTTEGWAGPFPLLGKRGVERVTEITDKVKGRFVAASQMSSRRHWFKSMHAYIPEFHDIACHPAIVNRIKAILGPDLIVWGQCITVRKPGQEHRWHVDVEHRRWPGVSVFVGLKGISQGSTLKVVSHSHKIKETPQGLKLKNDEAVIEKAREFQPSSRLIAVDLKESEFFMFDGTLWHASHNSSEQTRTAMVIQYSRPSAQVQIPLNWRGPIAWSSYPPPCVLVCGEDRYGINRLVGRPLETPG